MVELHAAQMSDETHCTGTHGCRGHRDQRQCSWSRCCRSTQMPQCTGTCEKRALCLYTPSDGRIHRYPQCTGSALPPVSSHHTLHNYQTHARGVFSNHLVVIISGDAGARNGIDDSVAESVAATGFQAGWDIISDAGWRTGFKRLGQRSLSHLSM